MDIKLKSNKAKSLLAALLIVLSASVGYLAMYPGFAAQAELFYEDSIGQEELWSKLCKSNYVLYKNIRESVQETRLTYEDVYFRMEEEKVSEEELQSAYNADTVRDSEDLETYKRHMLSYLPDWESSMLTDLYQKIDYCVIDNGSGKLLKNTDRSLETIRAELLSKKMESNPYYYFVSMEYDSGGDLQNVSVTGPESDKILKILQAQAQSSNLRVESENFYTSDGRRISMQMKQPASTTFLYGITSEQWTSMYGTPQTNTTGSSWWWEQYNAFYSTGAQGFYLLFLSIIMLLAFLMPKIFKSYCLQEMRWVRIPFEAVVAITIFLMAAMESVVSLIVRSSNDMLMQTWNRIMPPAVNVLSADYPGYLILKFVVNLIPLMFLFGAGYWMGTALGTVWDMGFRKYLDQRSILCSFWAHTKGFWQKKYRWCKEELLHVDLSKNADKVIVKYVILNFILLALLSMLWIFGIGMLLVYSVVLFLMIRKYIGRLQEQYIELLRITDSIASGNLNTPMGKNLGIFNAYQAQLARIQEGFKRAVDEEVKSQKMKTELITNVSHDLKTPLTAIITYIDLLKEENLTPEQRREYLRTLEKKSIRLKVLIEDLFEVSKADSRNIVLNPVPLDIGNLITQVYLEYQDRLDEQHLDFRFRMPEEKIILNLDSQKTYRVFENLYTNISKYAMPHTRVYLSMEPYEEGVYIELKNISASELSVNPNDLTERFVRGDSSRNTEGSGLGLAIASSFVELQGGTMRLEVDGDLFKVKIRWPWQTAGPAPEGNSSS